MSTDGVLYVATGERHLAEAVANARAARPFLGGRRIALVTDAPEAARSGDAFDLVMEHPDPRRSYRDKISALRTSPFERTLYLDTDARIVHRIDSLFELLEHHDVAAAHAPVRLPAGWRDPTVPPAFPEPNSGVLLLRRGPHPDRLLEHWLDRYDQIGQAWDQATLRSALWELLAEGLRLATLPPEANLRTTKPWIAGKGLPVMIVHGRIPDPEWPDLLAFLNDDIERFRTSEDWIARHPATELRPIVAEASSKPKGPRLADHLMAAGRRRSDSQDERMPCEDPVFVLAAGWRSGSTRLQRMLTSASDVMIWNEPHDRARVIQGLAEQWRPFDDSWPNARPLESTNAENDATTDGIGAQPPEVESLRQAHRHLLDRLYGEPARAAGRSRWGITEVRFDADHIDYLSWLFPGARFLLLVRDPFDAYADYRESDPSHFDWPAPPIRGPVAFGRLWSRLATAFHLRAGHAACELLRYEDLEISLDRIARHLGAGSLPPPSSLTVHDERGTPHRPGSLSRWERLRLAQSTSVARRLLGY